MPHIDFCTDQATKLVNIHYLTYSLTTKKYSKVQTVKMEYVSFGNKKTSIDFSADL